MRIVRGPRRQRDFLILSNQVARDSRLSFRARGVLVSILSRPDDWETDATRLSREGREGRDAIRAALAELELFGYLRRERRQDRTSGKWSTVTTVLDEPCEIPENPHEIDDLLATPQVAPKTGNQPSVSQALLRRTDTKDLPYLQPLSNPSTSTPGACGALLGEESSPSVDASRLPRVALSRYQESDTRRTTVQQDFDPHDHWVTGSGVVDPLNDILRAAGLSAEMRAAFYVAKDAGRSLQEIQDAMQAAWASVDLAQLTFEDVEALVASVKALTPGDSSD